MDVPPKNAPRLFLIDAYALIYRAFFAFIRRPLINSKGENTSAPFGFANFLLQIRDRYQPDYLAVVFDAGNSHREKVYPDYKATREKMPDELRFSLPRVRELVAGFNDALVELDGYEADDVIGTLAVKARDAGLEAVIVSGDKDLYQLVGPGIHLLNPGRGGPAGVAPEWIDESNAHEKFGVPASQVIDYLALIGDSSDNIPGAPGIGPKTALKLLEAYGSLEEVLAHAGEISGKRARESLTENAEKVRLSKQLVTIMTDLDVDLNLENLEVREPDSPRLHRFFVEMEFRRLMERFSPTEVVGEPPPDDSTSSRVSPGVMPTIDAGREGEIKGVPEYPGGQDTVSDNLEAIHARHELITDPDLLENILIRARELGRASILVYTSFPDPHRAALVGLALALEPAESFYLSFGHVPVGDPTLDFESPVINNLPDMGSNVLQPLLDFLEDPKIEKVGADLKASAVALARAGVKLAGVGVDVTIASYVLDPGRRKHDLETLCQDVLGFSLRPYSDVVGVGQKKISFSEVDQETARSYCGQQVDVVLRLAERFSVELEAQGLGRLFRELELPLVPVLTRMELEGIRIDTDFFETMNDRLGQDLTLIRQEIHKVAGEEFNLNSTQQLREILFEKQGLPALKRTKTGPSTDSSVLEELAAEGHEIPRLMLEYRELAKLRSTYVDALPQLMIPRTRRIHTRFNQTVAATGRLSSSDPNLQNIPIRTELGREIRKGFIPADGYLFYGADYSQVELRILAHFSGDAPLVQAFSEGIDVHEQTASLIFNVPLTEVTVAQRGAAKTINFATLYGQKAFSLARQLGIGLDEAKEFIQQYFERFSGVRSYLDNQVAIAREKGFVETLMGRRRYIPELRAKNWNVRQFGERVAQNTPIQGTAADMIKKAMVDVAGALSEEDTSARMLLQVHDELLFEVPKGEEDELAELVVTHMEGAMTLSVPLVVEGGVGKNWYETKS
ncbi:MAG: DNA polymerase I [Gemmatimonadota bacterium]|nr:DNA polymerase I [Gemmatimonadota bacterium]